MTAKNILTGKSVIITGASRGIGAATAYAFADAGATVILAARTKKQIEDHAAAIIEKGQKALAIACDVTSYKSVEALVSHTKGETGHVDILINNAGVIDPIATLVDSDPAAWGEAVDINVKGVYHGYRAALPLMLEAGEGTIINISSGAATNALDGWSHYCATKAAVLSLTKCGHKEVGDKGIRVMGLSPGTVATDMQVSIRASGLNAVSKLAPDAHIPPEWVAKALLYLAGPGGDKWCGQDFSIKTPEGRAAVGLPAP